MVITNSVASGDVSVATDEVDRLSFLSFQRVVDIVQSQILRGSRTNANKTGINVLEWVGEGDTYLIGNRE